jgi:heme/copper-type cytochrome/quinol oxidase subunit 1
LHIITAIAAFLMFAGVVIVIINIVRSLKTGRPAGDNPWEARTLEWQVTSPPPEDNFPVIPTVVGGPHGYGVPGSVHALMAGRGASEEGASRSSPV